MTDDEFLCYVGWTSLRWVQKMVREFGLLRSPSSSNVLASKHGGLSMRSKLAGSAGLEDMKQVEV